MQKSPQEKFYCQYIRYRKICFQVLPYWRQTNLLWSTKQKSIHLSFTFLASHSLSWSLWIIALAACTETRKCSRSVCCWKSKKLAWKGFRRCKAVARWRLYFTVSLNSAKSHLHLQKMLHTYNFNTYKSKQAYCRVQPLCVLEAKSRKAVRSSSAHTLSVADELECTTQHLRRHQKPLSSQQ